MSQNTIFSAICLPTNAMCSGAPCQVLGGRRAMVQTQYTRRRVEVTTGSCTRRTAHELACAPTHATVRMWECVRVEPRIRLDPRVVLHRLSVCSRYRSATG